MSPTRSRWTNRISGVVVAALALLTVAAGVAEASDAPPDTTRRYASQRGVQLGIQFGSTNLGRRTEPAHEDALVIDPKGGSVALRIGYQFTPNVALALELSGSSHRTNLTRESAVYGTAAFELRYQFVTGSRFQPFVMGGLGGSFIAYRPEDVDSRIWGGLALIGGGVQLHLSRHWRLELAARWDFINWEWVAVTEPTDGAFQSRPVNADGRAARLGLGMTWAF